MKTCSSCRRQRPINDFHRNRSKPDGLHNQCKSCRKTESQSNASRAYRKKRYAVQGEQMRAASRQWYKDNPEKVRVHKLWTTYHIGWETYQEILNAQGGRCAICKTADPGGTGSWHVDHDHDCCAGDRSCGECVRGLLCTRCNSGLGMFKDSEEILQAAMEYLAHNSKPPSLQGGSTQNKGE